MAKATKTSPAPSRVIIDRLTPQVDGGKYPAKRAINEPTEVKAVIFCDGHDLIKGRLKYRHESEQQFQALALVGVGNDIWQASFTPTRLGSYYFTVDACIDRWRTWSEALLKKKAAGQVIHQELEGGIRILGEWLEVVSAASPSYSTVIEGRLNTLRSQGEKLSLDDLENLVKDQDLLTIGASIQDKRSYVALEKPLAILVEPERAAFSSWYEFFPRSCTTDPLKHGSFRDCEAQLHYIAELGFDTVYLPPIHPIGRSHRKGKNNSLQASSQDVGSPWAIGGSDGGHKAIHPQLGTFADFANFLASAQNLGLAVALDIAFQCSPDHPYLKEHPEWFRWRSDGTIQYAENPPKKYEDIVPFDFECDAWQSLWQELLSVVTFWVEKGVTVFRVDNPHTKPLRFWQWLMGEVRKTHPEVIFLAEAFTRPHIMASLAKLGFSQSYTYFTWRDQKRELMEYLTELTTTELAEYFRPNFWPNTPDILTEYLSSGGRPAFMQKLILAATLSPNYGIYGPAFELAERQKRSPHNEEYQDSEKYEIRLWDREREDSLAPLLRRVNRIRRQNKALQSNRTLAFHEVSNDSLLAYSKLGSDGNMVLVVVNLDPHHRHAGMVDLPLARFGLAEDETFQVHDLISDSRYLWTGTRNYVELNPAVMPAHIFAIRRKDRTQQDFGYF